MLHERNYSVSVGDSSFFEIFHWWEIIPDEEILQITITLIDGRWKSAVNMLNPLGSKGQLTMAFASILKELWYEEAGTISPYTFRVSQYLYTTLRC